MTAVQPQLMVRYEGGSPGTEIWGMTQANFLVAMPGRHAKESAVNLTDKAALWLANELGVPDSKEFRQDAARQIGTAFFSSVVERGLPLESIVLVAEGFLEDHPELVAGLRATAPAA